MLELGQSTPPTEGLIKDATEASFIADVAEASREVPVIAYFWAPWCEPCKTLTPNLEAAVTAAKGKVRLVKVDVEQNQAIAAKVRVQSVPTILAFWQGQPVDGFQGALPSAAEIKTFIDRVAGLAGDGGLSEALEAAETMLADGATADAAEIFAAVLAEEPENAAALGGLARTHLTIGNEDQAEALLNNAPASIAEAPEVEAARAQLQLLRQGAKAGPVDDLKAAVEADPKNHQARFDLAQALHASGDVEGAVEELLELFRQDRNWNDEAAKTQLFTIFEALKPNDPIALDGRRRLSSMIFA